MSAGHSFVSLLLSHYARLVACAAILALTSIVDTAMRIEGDAQELIVVSDDRALAPPAPEHWHHPGCDALSVIDRSTGEPVQRLPGFISPGQLAATSNLSTIVSLSSNGGAFLHVARRRPDGWWDHEIVHDVRRPTHWLVGGAVAITRDDVHLIIATAHGVELYRLADLAGADPAVPKAIIEGREEIWPGAIELSTDGKLAYAIGTDGNVYGINLQSLAFTEIVVPYAPTSSIRELRTRRTFASLSSDGQILVVNGGDAVQGINVVDLRRRSSTFVRIEGTNGTYGVRFNRRPDRQDLLALHARNAVHVIRRLPSGAWVSIASAPLPELSDRWLRGGMPGGEVWWRGPSLAWDLEGSAIIAAKGGRAVEQEWRIFSYDPIRSVVKEQLDFDGCTWVGNNPIQRDSVRDSTSPLDVLTLHDRLETDPTPSATPSSSSTSMPPLPTPSPTTPPPPTTSPSLPSPSPTPSSTRVTVPLYLPLALREHCNPAITPVDIALVLDASSSMAGAKLDAAKAAARAFVAVLRLPRDRVAVVTFDGSARVVQPLTGDGAALALAIDGLATAPGTRIDRGIAAARGALAGAARAGAEAAIIVLTDGVQAEEPGLAVAEADAARAEGVTVYAVGLGEDIDRAQIVAIAGNEAHAHFAPAPGELAGVYGALARVVPCPVGTFWGRR